MISEPFIEASEECIQELRKSIPEAYLDRMTRLLYSTDASNYQMMPVGVVLPRSSDEIAGAIEIARILGAGCASGLEGCDHLRHGHILS